MARRFTTSYVEDSVFLFRYYKKLAEDGMAQIEDGRLLIQLDDESNSIAILIKHVAGGLLSRWTDFLTTDGEKPERNRDSEFVDPPATRAALMELWERGWHCLFHALEALTDGDLGRTITIRGEPHSVMQAINRATTHSAYHCGQIVLLAKHLRQGEWKSLSIPRGKSEEANRLMSRGVFPDGVERETTPNVAIPPKNGYT